MAATCERLKLNDTNAATLSAGKVYFDTTLPGLALVVGVNNRTFVVGRQKKRIGRFVSGTAPLHQAALAMPPVGTRPLCVSDARKLATVQLGRAMAAGDPVKMTFGLAFENWKTKDKLPLAIKNYTTLFDLHFQDWKNRELITITKADVRAKRTAIVATVKNSSKVKAAVKESGHGGHATANSALSMFQAVWNSVAEDHDGLPKCPTFKIKALKTVEPQTAIAPDEFKAWHADLLVDKNGTRRDIWLLALHSGVRRNSAQTMRWTDVDLETRVWHVAVAKGGRPFDLPLSSYVVKLLRARLKQHDKLCAGNTKQLPWVFPASSTSGHVTDVERAGSGHCFHDLRRTFSTTA
ncbi:MAG TPA: site-specific integrase, partial [Casimicrobiaceae bacterium]|nr:site-specific integrase [Casimicrobiaceae bacterium]